MPLLHTEVTASADLLLVNARVITLEPGQPATVVSVLGETIAEVGSHNLVAAWRGPRTRTIDCQGMTLLPGLIDAHCHLLALAASLTAVDCSPQAVRSIEELKEAVRRRAEITPPGRWIRAFGYDDLALAPMKSGHPTRWDLDQAAPHHPVRLDHRSGHATVLNSRALALAGIHRDTPDPVEGVIQRDGASGEPNGLLLELADLLRKRLGPLRSQAELAEGVAGLDQLLLRCGITSVQDAGPENDLARWETFQSLKDSGRLACRVTMLAGVSHLTGFRAAGLQYGDGDNRLRLGAAKGMLTLTTGALHPDAQQLREMVAEALRSGFPIALHAVEREAVEAVTRALQEAADREKGSHPGGPEGKEGRGQGGRSLVAGRATQPRHRIEHCAECPPDLVALVRRCGAMVVTQPGFVYWEGDRYLKRVEPSLLPHLYPVGSLARAGVPLAFGSDAPVIDPNPWPAISGAVTRSTRRGHSLPPEESGEPGQRVAVDAALRMYTMGGALAEGSQARKGSIAPGKLADLVLVDSDPREVAPLMLKDLRAMLTIIGGQVVWDGGP
jgi:predicted amidohydrolase YtcJ